eukprot:scaffold187477_cov32-Tisochrysis_lutea.AAC.5
MGLREPSRPNESCGNAPKLAGSAAERARTKGWFGSTPEAEGEGGGRPSCSKEGGNAKRGWWSGAAGFEHPMVERGVSGAAAAASSRLMHLTRHVLNEVEGAVHQADEAVGALLGGARSQLAGPSARTNAGDAAHAAAQAAAEARLRERVRALAGDGGAALLRPATPPAMFAQFCERFELLAHTQEIERRLQEDPELRATHRQLVPHTLTYKAFWERCVPVSAQLPSSGSPGAIVAHALDAQASLAISAQVLL